jgi:hypothetical protein
MPVPLREEDRLGLLKKTFRSKEENVIGGWRQFLDFYSAKYY